MKTLHFFILIFVSVIPLEAQNHPNIILISADDLGWSDLGCYGSEIVTPNLDKLAREGLRFTQFHNTSKCYPSRACLLTGVYAQDCGYDKTFASPIKNAITIGEMLQTEGYRTYWSGKHHGSENPFTRGFDHYFGLKDGACNYFNPGIKRNGEANPAQKRCRTWCIDGDCYTPYTPQQKDFYTTDYFTRYAIEYIEEAHNTQMPFFLYIAYNAPHDPLMAWPGDIEKYSGKYDCGYEEIRKKRYTKQKLIGLITEDYKLSVPTYQSWSQLSIKEKEFESKKMEVYAAMIDRLDQNIGKVLSLLKDLNLMDNTLIMFVSDNGASAHTVNLTTDNDHADVGTINRWVSLGSDWANVCNTPFRYYKSYSHEGGINTPFIVWWPKVVEAGAFSKFSGHFIDIMATISEITGASYPKEFNGETITPMRGQSLLPVFKGNCTERDKPLYWAWNKGSAMRLGNWKIVRYGLKNPWELYNLEDDPTETNNLAKKNTEIVYKLAKMFEEWQKQYQNN